MRRAILFASLLAGCKFNNPVGFWDIELLEVNVKGVGKASQEDFGTMEWVEEANDIVTYNHHRYQLTFDGDKLSFEPMQMPEATTAGWDDIDDDEGLVGLDLLGFFSGKITVDEYKKWGMFLEGEGNVNGDFVVGVDPTAATELRIELSR